MTLVVFLMVRNLTQNSSCCIFTWSYSFHTLPMSSTFPLWTSQQKQRQRILLSLQAHVASHGINHFPECILATFNGLFISVEFRKIPCCLPLLFFEGVKASTTLEDVSSLTSLSGTDTHISWTAYYRLRFTTVQPNQTCAGLVTDLTPWYPTYFTPYRFSACFLLWDTAHTKHTWTSTAWAAPCSTWMCLRAPVLGVKAGTQATTLPQSPSESHSCASLQQPMGGEGFSSSEQWCNQLESSAGVRWTKQSYGV